MTTTRVRKSRSRLRRFVVFKVGSPDDGNLVNVVLRSGFFRPVGALVVIRG